MSKREEYNARVISRYRRKCVLKNVCRYALITAGLIFFTIGIAEPYRTESLVLIGSRLIVCFLIGAAFLFLSRKVNQKEIKKPTITHKRPLTDYSKEMEKLALEFEVIEPPEK